MMKGILPNVEFGKLGSMDYKKKRQKWLKTLKPGAIVWCTEIGFGGFWKAVVEDVIENENTIDIRADSWRTVKVSRCDGTQHRGGNLRIYAEMPRNIMQKVRESRSKSYQG